MSENKQEEEDLPSMDALEVSKENKRGIKSIPTYFGGEDDDDIPDMEGFEDSDNLVESDPVNILFFFLFQVILTGKKENKSWKFVINLIERASYKMFCKSTHIMWLFQKASKT
jgi:hypothetical protein